MVDEVLGSAANEELVAAADKKEKQKEKVDLDEMRQVVSTKQGRRFIWQLMCDCGIFQCSFDGSSRTFFKEGERNVGLKILARLNNAHPEVYGIMIKESKGGDYDV